MAAFVLDPAFLSGSRPLASLRLCDARLQDDDRWPWIVLLPRRVGAVEIEDLSAADRAQLVEEIVQAGEMARAVGEAAGRPVQKLNVGALGNITPQLHVHVIGRRREDPAWPGQVWGVGAAQPYVPEALVRAREAALGALGRRQA